MENFLYYARAVDPTILLELGTFVAAQLKVTECTKAVVVQLIDYCDMKLEAKFKCHVRNMTWHIHSDVSYLLEIHSRSRAGGNFS